MDRWKRLKRRSQWRSAAALSSGPQCGVTGTAKSTSLNRLRQRY